MSTVLLASDKFKGTLTAAEVAAARHRRHRPGARTPTVVTVPVADGGDGTLAAAVAAGFERVPVTATGPDRRAGRRPAYARRGETAVVELADVSGLWPAARWPARAARPRRAAAPAR